LVRNAAKTVILFSDDTMMIKINQKEYYGEDGVLNEIISNTSLHIIFLLEDQGIKFQC